MIQNHIMIPFTLADAVSDIHVVASASLTQAHRVHCLCPSSLLYMLLPVADANKAATVQSLLMALTMIDGGR